VQQFRLLLNRKLCIAGQKEFGGKTAGLRIFSPPHIIDLIYEFAAMSRLCRVQSLGGRSSFAK
jgi:hypothetical protein